MKDKSCCCHSDGNGFEAAPGSPDRKKERTDKEYKDLKNRLSRIEGQVRGLKNMLENDAYCIDILTQASAVNSALNSFSRALLENHLKTCVVQDIREGREESMEELVATLQKLMK